MTVTVDSFLELYQQFNNISDKVEYELSISEATVPTSSNELLRDKAVSLLTAHVLSVEYRDLLDTGQILKETEQGSSIRKDIYLDDSEYYRLTVYGLAYKKLLKQVNGGGGAMFVA